MHLVIPRPPAAMPATPRGPSSRARSRRGRAHPHNGIAAVSIRVAAVAFAVSVWDEVKLPDFGWLSDRPIPTFASKSKPYDPAALYLVRSTLMSLDDANQTGNYEVLRLLGSNSFQAANSASDLARIFSAQRDAGLDLAVAALQSPHQMAEPTIGADRLLRLSGSYDQPAGQLQFVLAYAADGGLWRLEAIHVAVKSPADRIAASQ